MSKTETKNKKSTQILNRRRKSIAPSTLCLKPALIKFELIWAHIKGYSNWPGIIEEETPKGKYRIHFFGDYSTSDISRNKITHLMEGSFNFQK